MNGLWLFFVMLVLFSFTQQISMMALMDDEYMQDFLLRRDGFYDLPVVGMKDE